MWQELFEVQDAQLKAKQTPKPTFRELHSRRCNNYIFHVHGQLHKVMDLLSHFDCGKQIIIHKLIFLLVLNIFHSYFSLLLTPL